MICFEENFTKEKYLILLQKKKIQLTSKLQIPKDSFEKPGMTRKQLEKEIHENLKADCASTYRPKDESLEEKRSRKQAVKQERKVWSIDNNCRLTLYLRQHSGMLI